MSNTANKTLFIFPGQGSQYPGMGSDLHASSGIVRETYREASDALGYDIAELSFKDPQSQIHLTRYTQPAILTHSVACLRQYREASDNNADPFAVAGHSLGEYSALVAAGILEFGQALRLVKRRGELMGELGEGEMEALPVELEVASELADKHYCGVAACNLPDQTVVGGRPQDLDGLVADLQERFPRKRSTRLKTEGAFHTYYMVEAAKQFRDTLDDAEFRDSAVRVLSNYSGGFHDPDPRSIRSRLFSQLFNPVLWYQNLVCAFDEGVNQIVEFGGGIGRGETPGEKRPNLEGIVKKAFRRAEHPPEYRAIINQDTAKPTA